MSGSLAGRVYSERGRPVTVLTSWGRSLAPSGAVEWWREPRWHGPRNVAIRRESGAVVVRPFRGLRKTAGGAA